MKKQKLTPTQLYKIHKDAFGERRSVSFNQFCQRLRTGWTEERAITTPARVTAPAKKKSVAQPLEKVAKATKAVNIDKNNQSMQSLDKATSRLAKGQAKKVQSGETKNWITLSIITEHTEITKKALTWVDKAIGIWCIVWLGAFLYTVTCAVVDFFIK